METLRQLAYTAIGRLQGGDRKTTSEYSVQDIVFKLRGICNEFLKADYITKYSDSDRGAIAQCIASYELELENDPDCAFVTLPEIPINLPWNRSIHRIFQRAYHLSGDPTDKEFTLSHQPAIGLKTRTARYPGINICWQESFKIKFFDLFAEPGENSKIIAQIIVAAPSSIGEDDPLPIPPEWSSKILDRLVQQELNPPLTVQTMMK